MEPMTSGFQSRLGHARPWRTIWSNLPTAAKGSSSNECVTTERHAVVGAGHLAGPGETGEPALLQQSCADPTGQASSRREGVDHSVKSTIV
jgi:hypothetical protein